VHFGAPDARHADMQLSPFVTCRVPDSLKEVTSVGPAEIDSHDVGVPRAAIDRIWGAVERLYASGIHPAIQLCVRHRGEVIIDRAIGHASGNGPDDAEDARKVLATPATPFNTFSASKAVTAMVIHLLDERHLVHLDDPVCEYIPEFGVHRKHWITIRHVLTHRAGIPNLPPEAMELGKLEDPREVIELLCDAEPIAGAGRQLAYHAITGGFILGEIVRRVTGKDIREVLAEAMLKPLGFRWMNYGVAPDDVKRVAVNYFTGAHTFFPLSTLLGRLLGAPFEDVPKLSNDPRFLLHPIPAGNVVATANEMSRFYQLLLDGGAMDGVRVFDPRTIRRATSEQSYREFDATIGLPVRYGMGLMLGTRRFGFFGPDTTHAYGHLGFTNVLAWADPERKVAAALMNNGKPILHPGLRHWFAISREIGLACRKDRVLPTPVTRGKERAAADTAAKPGAPARKPARRRPPQRSVTPPA